MHNRYIPYLLHPFAQTLIAVVLSISFLSFEVLKGICKSLRNAANVFPILLH